MRICAVIVTYNRLESLIRCVAAVFNQTLRPEAVMIVDNCSDVSAAEVLRRHFAKELQIFRFKQNTGGAGGFHFGMAEAFRQGFDAVWLLDDDGAPSESCLANLVETGKRTVLGFSTPLVVNESNPDQLVFGLIVSGRFVQSTEAAVTTANSDGIIDGAVNPFNGSLISRDTYRRLGDLKFECFIWGDDLDYVERARASNIKVGTVASARYYHPTIKDHRIKFGPLQTDLQLYPPARSHFYFRNIGFIKAHHRGVINAAYHGANYLCFLLTTLQFAEAWKFVCYYLDGVFDLYLLKPSRSTLFQRLKQVSRVDLTSAIEREHSISK